MMRMASSMLTEYRVARDWLSWILICHLIVAPAISQVTWEPSEDIQIKQGKDMTLKCRANNIDPLGIVRILRRVTSTGDEDVITDNQNLKPNFAISKRYNISVIRDAGGVSITLSYTGIRGEDMGEILCFQLGKQRSAAKLILHVLVPVKEVYLLMKIDDLPEVELPDNSVAYVRQGQHTRLVCVVKRDGTVYPPNVDIQIGGNSELRRFVREDFPVTVTPNGKAAHESITMNFTMDTMTPKAEYHDKNLTCIAQAEGYEDEEAIVRLNVEFAPIITCPKYEWFGQLGKPITITCDIHANPGSTLTWHYGPDRDTATQIEMQSPSKHAVFVHKEEAFSEAHAHVSLTITALNVSHLTNFYLSAKNDIDNKEVTVTVSEGVVEVEVKQKPNNPSYSTKNKPSKRPRLRDPQRVRSRGSATAACLSSLTLVFSLYLALLHL